MSTEKDRPGPLRLRRHTDGRVAIQTGDHDWWTVIQDTASYRAHGEICVTGDGWVELLVAQLPGPDYQCDTSHGGVVDQWEIQYLRYVDGIVTSWEQGLGIEGVFHDAEDGEIDRIESDALKLLAAITTHRQYFASAEISPHEVTE